MLAVLLLPATGGGGGPVVQQQTAHREAAIFYYPWYSTPKRDGHWAHWFVPAEDGQHVLSTPYYPSRGLYSSSSAKVVKEHMREIAAAGLSTVIVSWWGWGSPEDLRLELVARAASKHGLSVAVHLEPYRGRTPASTAEDIAALAEKGYTDFYVYDADRDAAPDWAAALEPLGSAVRRVRAHAPRRSGEGSWFRRSVHVRRRDLERQHVRPYLRPGARAGLLCAPSVGPGYDARLTTRHHLVRPRLHGATYDRMWRAAVRAKADIVTITSYNEWQEGTQIEPARIQVQSPGYEGAWGKHGVPAQRAYLDATARWALRYSSSAVQ